MRSLYIHSLLGSVFPSCSCKCLENGNWGAFCMSKETRCSEIPRWAAARKLPNTYFPSCAGQPSPILEDSWAFHSVRVLAQVNNANWTWSPIWGCDFILLSGCLERTGKFWYGALALPGISGVSAVFPIHTLDKEVSYRDFAMWILQESVLLSCCRNWKHSRNNVSW